MHVAYEQYAAESRSGAQTQGLMTNDRRAIAIERDFVKQTNIDFAAMTLHNYENSEEMQKCLEPEQRSAKHVAENFSHSPAITFGPRTLRNRQRFLFSEEGEQDLFLAEEWSQLQGWLPFWKVYEAAKNGVSLGRPPES